MRAGRILLAGLILVGLFAAAVGAGYMLGQTAFRLSEPTVRPPEAPPSRSAVSPSIPSASISASQGGPVGANPSGGVPPVFLTGSAPTPPAPVPAPAASAQSGSAPPAPAGNAVSGTSPSRPVPPPAAPAAPTPPPAPTSASAPLPSPGSSVSGTSTPSVPTVPTRFHVQVGVFALEQNAEALALRVRARGYAVTVTSGPPFHVRVGGYVDRTTAEQLAQDLRKAGFESFLTP